jgi:KaiC/GvpD/RAD55 family RecA-like ATPase
MSDDDDREVPPPGDADAPDSRHATDAVNLPQAPVPTSPARYQRCKQLVAAILSRKDEPWVELRIRDVVIARLRLGQVAMLTGAPGSGKSTLALTLCHAHLEAGGVVAYVSVELDGDELVARFIGMQCDTSWEQVLRGKLNSLIDEDVIKREMERLADHPGFAVLDGDDATFTQLKATLERLRSEFKDAPIMVVVDYLQIVSSDEEGVRERVAAVAQQLRRFAKAERIVGLGISQPSRAAGRGLASSELLGMDTMTAMAESAEIERAAYVTMALGAHQPERADGTRVVDLSVGKGRMGGGDTVRALSYCGRSGRFSVDGEARPAAEVRAEKKAKADDTKVNAARLAMVKYAETSKESLTRQQLIAVTAKGKEIGQAALRIALDAGELVEVAVKRKRAPTWQLWTLSKAQEAGVQVVTQAVVEAPK